MRNCATLVVFLLCFVQHIRCQSSALEEEMFGYYWKATDVLYTQKDSAYFYLTKSENIALQLNDPEAHLDILSLYLSASDYHFDLSTSAKVLRKTDSILSFTGVKKSIDDYNTYRNEYQINQGNYYFKLGNFEKAKDYFLENRQQYTSKALLTLTEDEVTTLFSNNNFLGTIYKRLGKYELSEKYYLNNRLLIEQHPFLIKNNEAFLTNVNQLLGQLYVELKQPLKANSLFSNGVEVYKKFYQKNKKFKNNLVNVYQQVTKNYIAQDSLLKALKYIDESQAYLLPEDPFFKSALLLYGAIYSKQDKDQKAIEQYLKALEIFTEYRQNKAHQDIAEIHGKIAEFYLKKEDYKQGLSAIQQALRNTESNLGAKNPDPIKVFSKRQLLGLLSLKSQLQDLGYKKTDDVSYLEDAMNTNRALLKTFNLLKKEFDSKLDKQFLSKSVYPIFHQMLASTFEAYQLKPSPKLLELALNISEKNKDFLLLEALRNARATQYAAIPELLLSKEAQYRAEITHFEKQQFDSKEEGGAFSQNLFILKQEYYSFLDSLKQTYPKYHELKYGETPVSIAKVREKLLQANDLLITFTMTDDRLYAIVVRDTEEDFLSLPFSKKDKETVRNFYEVLSTASFNDNAETIAAMGKVLFAKILEEPLANSTAKNLIIIADDVLHYLPFDLLRNEEEYVLQSKIISYGNSVTSLLELQETYRTGPREMLAFAPVFNGQETANKERQLGKLNFNDDEVERISAFYKTGIFADTSATVQNFVAKAPDYGMIHLATHASANDKFPDYSYLAFSSDSDNGSILYIKDLYNMSLNAEMVTLSACQTGIGKLQKGQGMMSLSKGFYYAGAKSLVNSLWKINDKSTVKLMEFFYEGLSKGKSKKEALRNAKLKYLETTDDNLLKHPYYWAAFVVSGNTDPIRKPISSWWWLLTIPALAMTSFYIKRKISG